MYLRIILASIFVSVIAWKNGKDCQPHPKSATELLTEDTWILRSYGIDENGNDSIDPGEDMMQECDGDNTCEFGIDKTGLYSDGNLICGNGIVENPFTWKFTENEKALDFMYGIARIFRLNERELILYYEINFGSRPVKFFTIYRH